MVCNVVKIWKMRGRGRGSKVVVAGFEVWRCINVVMALDYNSGQGRGGSPRKHSLKTNLLIVKNCSGAAKTCPRPCIQHTNENLPTPCAAVKLIYCFQRYRHL